MSVKNPRISNWLAFCQAIVDGRPFSPVRVKGGCIQPQPAQPCLPLDQRGGIAPELLSAAFFYSILFGGLLWLSK